MVSWRGGALALRCEHPGFSLLLPQTVDLCEYLCATLMTPRNLRDVVLCCVNQTKSNQRPSENEAFELVDGGDGCAALPRAYDQKTWVLLSANNCSAGAAAKHGARSGAGGVIITAAPLPEAPCTNPLICPAAAPEELAACG